jgi:DNA-binding NarL/FixJ family response regulator
MIRVLLVDDQTLVRQGIKSLLELTADIRAVAEAADGEQALEQIACAAPDVILLDVRMPKKSGLDVLAALRERGVTPPPTLLLTTFDDDAVALEGLRLGARGFLLKDVSLEELTVAIRTLASGSSLVAPAVQERVRQGLERVALDFDASPLPGRLTLRETEVLRLVARGFSNREIAEALGTAEGTVKNQVSSVMSKLGVRDRTRAVLKALELGYV